jgi:uncharacterized protein YbjT (DUF2867 family)
VNAPSLIVVTGSTGFTGAFVVRELAQRFPSARLRCFVRASSDRRVLEGNSVEFVEGDLHDERSLDAAFRDADTLVNVASLGFGWVDSLFAAIRRSHLRRGVFVSTTAILTRLPVKSRAHREHGERLVRDSGLAWTILRPTMIYGTSGDRNIARLIAFLERSPIVPVIAPDARQQPVHVADVASAVAAVVDNPRTVGQVYNLSGREPVTFETLVREAAQAAGRRPLIVRLPFGPVLGIVRLYNSLVSKPRIKVEQVLRLREDKAFDHAAARDDFGFAPRSFAEGVREEVRVRSADARKVQ